MFKICRLTLNNEYVTVQCGITRNSFSLMKHFVEMLVSNKCENFPQFLYHASGETFRQIIPLVISLCTYVVKTLLSRNFCQKRVNISTLEKWIFHSLAAKEIFRQIIPYRQILRSMRKDLRSLLSFFFFTLTFHRSMTIKVSLSVSSFIFKI